MATPNLMYIFIDSESVSKNSDNIKGLDDLLSFTHEPFEFFEQDFKSTRVRFQKSDRWKKLLFH